MKYCILSKDNTEPTESSLNSIGFYQWLKVFRGQILGESELDKLNDGDYDLIHIRLSKENLSLLMRLKERLGKAPRTRIAASMDIPADYWLEEFGNQEVLKSAVENADFVSATDYTIAQALSEISGQMVYNIPHPADLLHLSRYRNTEKKPVVTIISGNPSEVIKSIRWIRRFFGKKMHIRIIAYRYENAEESELYRRKNLELIICRTEEELCRNFAESEFVYAPEPRLSYKNEYHSVQSFILYCAALGTLFAARHNSDASCLCFTDITNHFVKSNFRFFTKAKKDNALLNQWREDAKIRVEHYSWGNLQQKWLDLLYHHFEDERFHASHAGMEHPSFSREVCHMYGPKTVSCERDEFVIICLVKNGAEYIPSFINYYQRLGARHFFFVDNGSTDATITLIKRYPNTTIYDCKLPHGDYEVEMRQVLIQAHCMNHWCLCVDIDELFDYPCSGQLSMHQFLRYLNTHGYTTVLSYLLDMFAREIDFSPASDADNGVDKDLASQYCYYDISRIQKQPYHASFFYTYNHLNRLADPKMKNYMGGIRRELFPLKIGGYLLTKHPLVFIDGKIDPLVHPHFCNKGFVADVNGVLKHYKFIATFKDKVLDRMKSHEVYSFWAKQEYKAYYDAVKDKNRMSIDSPKAQKLESVDQLLRQGFLRASSVYKNYCEKQVFFRQYLRSDITRQKKPKIAFISLMPDPGHVISLLRVAVSFKEQQFEVQGFFPEESSGLAKEFDIPMQSFGKITNSVHKEAFDRLSRRSIFYNAFSAYKDLKSHYTYPITEVLITRINLIKDLLERYDPTLIIADDHQLQAFLLHLAGHLDKPLVFHSSGGNYHYKKQNYGADLRVKFSLQHRWYRIYSRRYIFSYGYTERPFWIQGVITGVGCLMDVLSFLSMFYSTKKIEKKLQAGLQQAFPQVNTDRVKPVYISTGLPFIEREMTRNFFTCRCQVELFPPLNDKRAVVIRPSLQQWLENTQGKPIVYIGLGTMVQGNIQFARKIIQGLAGLDICILWAAPAEQIRMLNQINHLPNLRFEEYVPQPQVLAHKNVACLISHGGSGGIQDSLFYGKPVLCIPFMFDHPFNSSLVEVLQVGIKLWKHRITAELVHNSVRKLLYEPSYRKNAQSIMKLLQGRDVGSEIISYLENFLEMDKQAKRTELVNV